MPPKRKNREFESPFQAQQSLADFAGAGTPFGQQQSLADFAKNQAILTGTENISEGIRKAMPILARKNPEGMTDVLRTLAKGAADTMTTDAQTRRDQTNHLGPAQADLIRQIPNLPQGRIPIEQIEATNSSVSRAIDNLLATGHGVASEIISKSFSLLNNPPREETTIVEEFETPKPKKGKPHLTRRVTRTSKPVGIEAKANLPTITLPEATLSSSATLAIGTGASANCQVHETGTHLSAYSGKFGVALATTQTHDVKYGNIDLGQFEVTIK